MCHFFVRWPQEIAPAKDNHTICHTDFFATVAEVLNIDTNNDLEGEDSFSFLSLLKNENDYTREPVIHHSANGTFAIRKGNWKLILNYGSGGRQKPAGKPFEGEYQLYNLLNDLKESNNLVKDNPDKVKELIEDFNQIHTRTEKPIDHNI